MTAAASIPLTSTPSAFGQGIRDLLDSSVALARGLLSLSRAERAVAQALTMRMDWDEWSFPPRFDRSSWLSVARIGEDAGYGRRRACWALRQLEHKGLLEVDRRAPQCSAYRWVTDKWEALVGAHRVERATLDRERMEARRQRWEKLLGAAAVTGDDEGLGDVPSWAVRAARDVARGDVSPEVVWRLVARIVAVVHGQRNDPADLGAVAKPVVNCWEAMRRPSEEDFAAQLQLVLDAAVAHGKGRALRRLWRGRSAARNRSSIPYMLAPKRFGKLVTEAQAWLDGQSEQHPVRLVEHVPEEVAPGQMDLEGNGGLPWRPALEAALGTSSKATSGLWDIAKTIASNATVEGDVNGRTVLRVTNEPAAKMLRDHAWPHIVGLAGGVRVVWGHPPNIG